MRDASNFRAGTLTRNLNIAVASNFEESSCIRGPLADAHEEATKGFTVGRGESNDQIFARSNSNGSTWTDNSSINLELEATSRQLTRSSRLQMRRAHEWIGTFAGPREIGIRMGEGKKERSSKETIEHGDDVFAEDYLLK